MTKEMEQQLQVLISLAIRESHEALDRGDLVAAEYLKGQALELLMKLPASEEMVLQ